MSVISNRRLAKAVLRIFFRLTYQLEEDGLENLLKIQGKGILVSNHLGWSDVFAFAARLKRNDMIVVVAEKYEKYSILRYFAKQLDLLWLDRFASDLGTLREVLRRLEKGGILLIAPEGTRSRSETLLEGKPGAAFLASKSGASITPAAIYGSEDRVVMQSWRRLRRPLVHIIIGESFTIPSLPKQNRDVFLREQTDEIMTRIAALLPEKYRGVYAQHSRLRKLVTLKG